MSHDLRTPLTAITTAGHALAGSDVQPGEREELASASVAESERLTDLIEKLPALSRLQSRPSTVQKGTCSLEEPLLAAKLHVAGAVRLTIDPELTPIHGDAAQLERAFANLLENAVATAAGTRWSSVRIASETSWSRESAIAGRAFRAPSASGSSSRSTALQA